VCRICLPVLQRALYLRQLNVEGFRGFQLRRRSVCHERAVFSAEHCSRASCESVSNYYIRLFVFRCIRQRIAINRCQVSFVRPSVCMERVDSSRVDFHEICIGDFN
jgi:hypothetical protein